MVNFQALTQQLAEEPPVQPEALLKVSDCFGLNNLTTDALVTKREPKHI